jgi:catechol 2,3-dioxygenase-like lactoylglutathione lyase family enzyme
MCAAPKLHDDGAMIRSDLACISISVRDLAAMERFYTEALGFERVTAPAPADPALAALLGATSLHILPMQRGRQTLELWQCDPPGTAYPTGSRANDLWFQHCALATDDIEAAYARLRNHRFTPISRNGPQPLPGGIVAFKFRDPESHPLELIQFPQANPATAYGIDHSAIVVADAARSIAFYADTLGLAVTARQRNQGAEQDALDALDGAIADVIALTPACPSPHVELLAYSAPPGRPAPPMRPAPSRLIFTADALPGHLPCIVLRDGRTAAATQDPDGHAVLIVSKGGLDAQST